MYEKVRPRRSLRYTVRCIRCLTVNIFHLENHAKRGSFKSFCTRAKEYVLVQLDLFLVVSLLMSKDHVFNYARRMFHTHKNVATSLKLLILWILSRGAQELLVQQFLVFNKLTQVKSWYQICGTNWIKLCNNSVSCRAGHFVLMLGVAYIFGLNYWRPISIILSFFF